MAEDYVQALLESKLTAAQEELSDYITNKIAANSLKRKTPIIETVSEIDLVLNEPNKRRCISLQERHQATHDNELQLLNKQIEEALAKRQTHLQLAQQAQEEIFALQREVFAVQQSLNVYGVEF